MKKIKFIMLMFLFVIMGLLLNTAIFTKAETNNESLIKVLGAQIRTKGTQGIRFVGTVEDTFDTTGVSRYGVAIAFGEANLTDITVGGTVNGKEVLNAEVTKYNEDRYFYISLINIPEESYGQKVTARAYVVRNDKYEYADTKTTRSLGEVALKMQIDYPEFTCENLTSVMETLETSYMKTYKVGDYVYVNDALYEYEPTELAKYFIKDFNEVTGESITTMSGFLKAYNSGKSEVGTKDELVANKLYKFFNNNNQAMLTKWGWVLDYIQAVVDNTYMNTQIDYIKTTEANLESSLSGFYGLQHLLARIEGFFTRESVSLNYSSKEFVDSSLYNSLATFMKNNNIEFDAIVKSELVALEDSIVLETLSSKVGYIFDGYVFEKEVYTSEYEVTLNNAVLEPAYSILSYGIKYMNNEVELDTLSSSYTVEDEVILPEFELEGYDFLGWYEESDFSGDIITSIAKGTTGEKIYYAKLQEAEYTNVNVTFDTNGGSFAINDIPSINTLTVSKAANTSSDNITYMTDNTPTTLTFHNKIVLNYDSSLNMYEIVSIITGSEKIALNTLEIKWTNVIGNYSTDITSNLYVGNYILINYDSLKSGIVQEAKVYDLSYQKGFTTVLKEPCDLLTPYKENDPFIGWESSVDGEIVTEYSGYSSNPGNITYTAIYQSTNSEFVNVNVTFDTNGGYLSTPQFTFTVNSFKLNGSTPTYMLDNTTGNSLLYQYKILLNYDSNLDLYKVVAIDAKKNALSDLGVTWTHAIADLENDITSYAEVGQYISIDINALKDGVAQTAAVFDEDVNISKSVVYNKATTLPIPYKEGISFIGWRCSLDDEIYTEYPGYKTNPGDITYTAEWQLSENDINAALNEINLPNVIQDDIFLPKNLSSNLTTTWTSSNTSLISNNGIVNKSVTSPKQTTLTVSVNANDKTYTKEFDVIIQPVSHFIMDNLFDNGTMTNLEINDQGKLVLKNGATSGTFVSGEFSTNNFTSLVGTWIATSSKNATCELLVSLKVNGTFSSYVTYGKWGLGLQNAADDQTAGTIKLSTDEVLVVSGYATAFKYKLVLRRDSENYESPAVKAVTFALKLSSMTYDVDSSLLKSSVRYDVPKLYQHAVPTIGGIICSVTSSTMLLKYKGHDFSSYDSLEHRYTAALFKDYGNGIYGNWVYCCVGMSSYGETAYVKRFASTNEFLYSLQEVGPMAASIKGTVYYYNTTTASSSSYYTAGHLLVVTGYEITGSTTYIYINDPNVNGVAIRMTLTNFLNVWRNVSYIIE